MKWAPFIRSREAFTLIELLVVIAILAVLAALLVPGFTSMIERGNRTKSSGNLRQIGAAMMSYAGDHGGYLPPAQGQLSDGSSFNPQGWWWAVHLLPFTGRNVKIFDRPGLNQTWSDPRAADPVTGKPFRIGYWINGGADPNVAFCHAAAFIQNIDSGKNYKPFVGFPQPARTVAIIDGIAGSADNLWNPDSRGNWRSGSNSKYHRWSGEKVDGNGLNAQGKVPEGSFNVLWLDGHVSLEKSSTLKTEDFLREK
jgi:prepilin-type N-terminal cleavage/methylation domain-containing protein/prepilin-type processing-associated H-X9-DG protein